MKTINPNELLCNKNILLILNGDEVFGDIIPIDNSEPVKISMPYLSGPDLCNISNTFGLPVSYGFGSGTRSRWAYLDDLLRYCISNNTLSNLLSYLFSKKQFSDKLKGKKTEAIDDLHKRIVENIIQQINGILYFGGYELFVSSNIYQVKQIGKSIVLETPAVKNIDSNYIKDITARAMKDISENNFDSAITKSKTLLEEVFCYVIEKKGDVPSSGGDISKLYSQVKNLYTMHQKEENDKRINMLLSGLEKILSAISQMRNIGSDAHGLGSKRFTLYEHHTRLFVNSAITMSDFILSVSDRKYKQINQGDT